MDLRAVAEKYHGTKYGELVLEQAERTPAAALATALEEELRPLTREVRAMTTELMRELTEEAEDPELWNMVSPDRFRNICGRAHQRLKELGVEPAEELLAASFIITVFSFAQKAQEDPAFLRYIQRSIGIGFFRRLLG